MLEIHELIRQKTGCLRYLYVHDALVIALNKYLDFLVEHFFHAYPSSSCGTQWSGH